MFRFTFNKSLDLKEISPGIKRVYCMGSHIVLQDYNLVIKKIIIITVGLHMVLQDYNLVILYGVPLLQDTILQVYNLVILYGIPYNTHFLYLD
jgi:hypothetical protein